MEGYRVLEIKQSVFENNDRQADLLRGRSFEEEYRAALALIS